jgi:hypothetical protein
MKKGIIILLWIVLMPVNSCRTGDQNATVDFVPDADYIQIVLFHLEQRCESCNAVEKETMWLLEEEYGEEILSGELRFIPLNFQTENGKKAAGLLRASGQTLFVVKGDSIADLTSAAFMYASTHPEYYHEALSLALNKYLE